MPTYDYRCTACGARFEAWQKFSDEPIRVCPTCSGPAQRVIHAPAISFKGSGFYITDSKGSGAAAPVTSEATASADSAPKAAETPKAGGDSAKAATPAPGASSSSTSSTTASSSTAKAS